MIFNYWITNFRNQDGKPYIIKANTKSVPSQKKIQKYFREFMIGASIKSDYVVKYVDMKKYAVGFSKG